MNRDRIHEFEGIIDYKFNNIKVLIILLAIIAFFVLFVGGILPYFIFYVVLLASLIPLIHNLIILKH